MYNTQIRLAGALQQMLANGPAAAMGADGLQGLLGEPEEDEYNLVSCMNCYSA